MDTTLGVSNSTIKKNNVKRLVQGAFLLLVFIFSWWIKQQATPENEIESAIYNKSSGVMVEFDAKVERLLKDDNTGSRHQKFIVQTGDNTVLIAHNIDLASRVPIQIGDQLSIRGQYEWNDKGGVVHWTHHDPQNRRVGGWIVHNEKKFK